MRHAIGLILCAALVGCQFSQPLSPPPQISSEPKPDLGYEQRNSTHARITVVFIPGSGRLSREQLDSPDFPGARVLKFTTTVRLGENFPSLRDLVGIADDQYRAAVASVTSSERLIGSIQIVRTSRDTGKREVISYRSHTFYLGGVVFSDGDYLVAREVTGY